MNIKEVKIVMYLCLEDMPEVKTRADIADALNNVLYENPDLWGELTEENIVDVREFEQPDGK
jgi:hypothetical protein